jgi:hypothetical protein
MRSWTFGQWGEVPRACAAVAATSPRRRELSNFTPIQPNKTKPRLRLSYLCNCWPRACRACRSLEHCAVKADWSLGGSRVEELNMRQCAAVVCERYPTGKVRGGLEGEATTRVVLNA